MNAPTEVLILQLTEMTCDLKATRREERGKPNLH